MFLSSVCGRFNLPLVFRDTAPLRFFLPPIFSPAYQITYHLNSTNSNTAMVDVLNPSARQYTVTSLKPESVYVFRITAQTRKGWGEAAEALVVTTEKRGNRVWQIVLCIVVLTHQAVEYKTTIGIITAKMVYYV